MESEISGSKAPSRQKYPSIQKTLRNTAGSPGNCEDFVMIAARRKSLCKGAPELPKALAPGAAIMAAAVLSILPGTAFAENLVIRAGQMLDVESGRVLKDQALVIEGEKIIAVMSWAKHKSRKPEKLIDLSGYWVSPGLIDTHVHLTSEPTLSPYESYNVSAAREAVIGAANARKTLLAGVTTVRNLGAGGYSDIALRDGIARGEIPGPRIFGAGASIGITGGHCDENNLAPEYGWSAPGVADGVDGVRKAVRRNIKFGADLIKYCGTGGVFSKGTLVGAPQYSPEEARALVTEAHSQGRKVAVHAHGAAGIRIGIEAGVDTVEHASLIDDEGIRMAKAAGTILSMDIYNTDYTQAEGKKNGVPEEFLQKDRDIGEIQRQNFRKAHLAGVKLSFGTDAGIFPHGDNARQLAVMTRYGMSPMQAIQAATLVGAESLGANAGPGLLAPGHAADVIAVATDPLADISALERMAFVMKAGKVYRGTPAQCAAAPASWACEPPAGQ